MQPSTPLFHRWLEAEKAARAAEREVHKAMLRFAAGGGPPSAEEVRQAAQLREGALVLFPQAMQELKQIAEALRPITVASSPLQESREAHPGHPGAGAAMPRQPADGIRSQST